MKTTNFKSKNLKFLIEKLENFANENKDKEIEMNLNTVFVASNGLLSGFHGVYLKIIHEALRELGNDYTISDSKTEIKKQSSIMKKEVFNEMGSLIDVELRSLKDLNHKEWTIFLEDVKRFSAEFLNIELPDLEKKK